MAQPCLTQLDGFAGGKMGGFGELQLPTSDKFQTPPWTLYRLWRL
jgi:hypothetical protein